MSDIREKIEDDPITLIVGKSGSGKTSTLKRLKKDFEASGKVVYLNNTEAFFYEFLNILRLNGNTSMEMDEFRNKIMQHDVFMLDNINYLIGKSGMQSILVNIINEFEIKDKKIVLTSNKSINEFGNFLDDFKYKLKRATPLMLIL